METKTMKSEPEIPKIEKDIPYRNLIRGRPDLFGDIFNRMVINDSVEYKILTYSAVYNRILKEHKNNKGKKTFKCQKTEQGTVRMWRIA